MSYGQPPSRNAYGDQDFIKEDFNTPLQPFTTPQSPPGAPQSPYARPNPAYNLNAPYSTPAPPQLPSYNMQQSPLVNPHMQQQPLQQQQQPGGNSFRELLSLTPEDQLFMSAWRRDCFLYRTLPLTLAGSGALFYYNQLKSLPQKPLRYLLVAAGAYIAGRYTYTGELKRRLEGNPSNTPFMRKMRELLGVKASFSELDSNLAQDYGGFGSSNDLSQPLNLGGGFARPSPGPRTSAFDQTPNYQPQESDLSLSPPRNDSTSKTMTSYEELRARNRGMI